MDSKFEIDSTVDYKDLKVQLKFGDCVIYLSMKECTEMMENILDKIKDISWQNDFTIETTNLDTVELLELSVTLTEIAQRMTVNERIQ